MIRFKLSASTLCGGANLTLIRALEENVLHVVVEGKCAARRSEPTLTSSEAVAGSG